MKDIWKLVKKFFEDRRLHWLWTMFLVVAGTWFTTYLVQYLLLDPELFTELTDEKWDLNRACVMVGYLLFLCITNHVGISAMLSHGFFMVMAFINYYVYLFRENEFIFADLRSIGTGLSVAGNYRIELSERGWQVILASIVFVVIASAFRIRFKRGYVLRLLSGLTAVLICILIFIKTDGINTETWEQKGSYKNGYVLNFVLSARDSFVKKPEGYELETITKLEETYNTTKENPLGDTLEKKPTIIVVMNESFADLSVLGELKTNKPLTPFLDSLSENTVKGYAAHEKETLEAVVSARTRATQVTVDADNLTPEKLAEYQKAQGEVGAALGRLLAITEEYPDLKANQNFLELQAQLEGTENRISVERRNFNEAAKVYNTSIRKFPKNILAGMFGFEKRPYFESQEGADKVPAVEF